jgi:hypothetical protein
MRALHDHCVPGSDSPVQVYTVDEPGPGGANHHYHLRYPAQDRDNPERCVWQTIGIPFQHGASHEAGVNGVTNEALLAVVLDRLDSFQKGPLSCQENELALGHVRLALQALHQRTRERSRRGVEGRLVP